MIEELQAVEMLEYHNKNWFDGDNKSRCEEKLDLLKEMASEVDFLRRMEMGK